MKDQRCLRLLQNKKLSFYEQLLEKKGQSLFSINVWNAGKYGPGKTPYLDTFHAVYRKILSLTIKMLQIKHGQSREIVTDIFTQATQEYNFWKNRDSRISSVNTVYHGSENNSH